MQFGLLAEQILTRRFCSRLATVQNADVIFVLGEGKVLETGDHNTLLRKRGVYFQMVGASKELYPHLSLSNLCNFILTFI